MPDVSRTSRQPTPQLSWILLRISVVSHSCVASAFLQSTLVSIALSRGNSMVAVRKRWASSGGKIMLISHPVVDVSAVCSS